MRQSSGLNRNVFMHYYEYNYMPFQGMRIRCVAAAFYDSLPTFSIMHYIRQFLRLGAATQAVIGVVQQELDKFDAVCMATALHTLASMRASAQQYAALFEGPEILRLMHVIGERCRSSILQSSRRS